VQTDITTTEHGVKFAVRVIPRARKNEIAGWHGGTLKIRLAAPPVEGAANAALVAFLAELLGVRQRDVVILQGERSRDKVVAVRGIEAIGALEALRGSSE